MAVLLQCCTDVPHTHSDLERKRRRRRQRMRKVSELGENAAILTFLLVILGLVVFLFLPRDRAAAPQVTPSGGPSTNLNPGD